MATFREIGNDPIIIDAILAEHPGLRQNRSAAIRIALEHWWGSHQRAVRAVELAAQPQRPEAQVQPDAGQQMKGEENV
jgi:hypothetical protein